MAQPRHTDALARPKAFDPFAERQHLAYDLVPGDDGQLRMRQLAVYDVKISSTDAAGPDADKDLAGPRPRIGKLRKAQRPAGLIENHGPHRGSPVASETMSWSPEMMPSGIMPRPPIPPRDGRR